MADIEYRVLIDFQTSGSLEADVDKAHAKAGHLGHVMGEMASLASETGHHLVEGFQHAVEHAASLASHVAKLGVALGITGAAYGVAHLNAELEQTQISLASIFKAQGFSDTFNKAFDMAGDQVSKMKQDIKSLPGDLGQLSNVMLQLSSPLANAGKSPDEIRQMAGKTMLASQILLGAKYGSGAQEIGAREMVQLLNGQFGSRNSWAMEMPGMQEHKAQWKNYSEEKRLSIIQEKIDNLTKDAGPKFATSWAAIFTTLKDNLKYTLLAPATSPLFEHVKATMQEINDWFDKNKSQVARFAQVLGDGLAEAWDKGIHLAQEWIPPVLQFAKDLRHELEIVWDKLAPALQVAGDALKNALGDGTAIRDIGKVLELYAVSKVAGGGSQFGRAIGSMAGAAFGPGGAAAGGAVGDFGGVGTLGGGLGIALQKAIEAGLVGAMKDHPAETAEAMGELAKSTQHLMDVFDTTMAPGLEKFAIANLKLAADALEGFARTIDWIQHPFDGLITITESVTRSMGGFGDVMADAIATLRTPKLNPEGPETYERGQELGHMLHVMGNTITSQNAEAAAAAHKKGAGGGGGGTHVQKVEIVVNTNQDANRVAEMVVSKIQNLNRHPKVSRNVPNFSSGGVGGPGF